MSSKKFVEPRNASYSKEHTDYYQDKDKGWLVKENKTIFGGKLQKDLFIFAYAVGKNRERKGLFKPAEKVSNVYVTAMKPEEKWAILSLGIAETGDILCLDDQKKIFESAEEYAKEGIEVIKSNMDRYGSNYPKQLEYELKEILGIV